MVGGWGEGEGKDIKKRFTTETLLMFIKLDGPNIEYFTFIPAINEF